MRTSYYYSRRKESHPAVGYNRIRNFIRGLNRSDRKDSPVVMIDTADTTDLSRSETAALSSRLVSPLLSSLLFLLPLLRSRVVLTSRVSRRPVEGRISCLPLSPSIASCCRHQPLSHVRVGERERQQNCARPLWKMKRPLHRRAEFSSNDRFPCPGYE